MQPGIAGQIAGRASVTKATSPLVPSFLHKCRLSLKVLPHFLLSALLQTLALANRFLDGEDAGSVDKLSGLECLADQTTRKFEAFAFLTGPRTRG